MSAYRELLAQAEKLMKDAEALRAQEQQQAIEQIVSLANEHGITLEQLKNRLTSGTVRRARKHATTPAVIKYRGPNGEGWAGGRGRKPQWVKLALAEGHSLEEFAVKP